MISVGEACLLGAVQGLTEFLPVSSDGHLALTQQFLTPMPADQKLAIDVALHAGTLVALIIYFWADLWGMARELLEPRRSGWLRSWVWLVGVGTIPAAIVGLTLRDFVADTYDSLWVIGGGFLVTGTLVFLGSCVRGALRSEETLDRRDAIMIGVFQVSALLPGVSRSGSTIAAALFRRIRPDVAARFSFLLGIPAIAGAVVLEGPKALALGPEAYTPLAAGILVALITGLVAIWLVMRAVASGRLHWFAYYTWTLGVAVLLGAALS
ncbi:MAG: undecaprenyl-diphosphate phosphatase [bacterium]|nr:undecaprenyl-diphosphate phosphatase [bacterium]